MATPLITAIALDLGTTSIKAALLDQYGRLHNIISQPAPRITASHGHYESDALQYVEISKQVLDQCRAQTMTTPPLGLCSQRSSFLVWEKASGQPLTPLISWQDSRGLACCENLHAREPIIHGHTGLRLTPYYFAPKLSVLLQDHPTWRIKLENREWLVGTLDTFLIWHWTHGELYITDASMAARTLLMDRRQQQWSPVLGKLFNIPLSILPQIKPSTRLKLFLDNGLTLQTSMSDQSAALIACIAKDPTKTLVNLGTGGFVIRYQKTEKKKYDSYLHTLIYQDKSGCTHTAIEGTLNSIAAALAPYPVDTCRIEHLAASNIFCLAEPSGLGAPYFRDDWGIYFSQSIKHLTTHQTTTLLLEAIIFRVVRILEDFHQQSPVMHIYLSGGLSNLVTIQQGIAQCLPIPVFHLEQKETSLQGTAILAANIQTTCHQKVKQVEIIINNNTLVEKYQRWKDWLDHLLATNPKQQKLKS